MPLMLYTSSMSRTRSTPPGGTRSSWAPGPMLMHSGPQRSSTSTNTHTSLNLQLVMLPLRRGGPNRSFGVGLGRPPPTIVHWTLWTFRTHRATGSPMPRLFRLLFDNRSTGSLYQLRPRPWRAFWLRWSRTDTPLMSLFQSRLPAIREALEEVSRFLTARSWRAADARISSPNLLWFTDHQLERRLVNAPSKARQPTHQLSPSAWLPLRHLAQAEADIKPLNKERLRARNVSKHPWVLPNLRIESIGVINHWS